MIELTHGEKISIDTIGVALITNYWTYLAEIIPKRVLQGILQKKN